MKQAQNAGKQQKPQHKEKQQVIFQAHRFSTLGIDYADNCGSLDGNTGSYACLTQGQRCNCNRLCTYYLRKLSMSIIVSCLCIDIGCG